MSPVTGRSALSLDSPRHSGTAESHRCGRPLSPESHQASAVGSRVLDNKEAHRQDSRVCGAVNCGSSVPTWPLMMVWLLFLSLQLVASYTQPYFHVPIAMGTSHHAAESASLPSIVHWVVSALVGIVGVALATVGSFLAFFVDQAMVNEAVSSGQVTILTTERPLSEAEMAALGMDVATWTGIGLLVTGIALTIFGVIYGVKQYRVDSHPDSATHSQRAWQAATVGAVVAVGLSFVPFSTLLGGGVAGYLTPSGSANTTRVGALAGLLVAIPAVLIIGFTTVGLYTGLAVLAETGLQLLTVGVMIVTALFVLAVSIGLGGLGGYVAPIVADR